MRREDGFEIDDEVIVTPTQEDTNSASRWVSEHFEGCIADAVERGDATMLAMELSYLLARLRERGGWDSMQAYGMKPRSERP